MTTEIKYRSRTNNPIYNTSYPINPQHWGKYRACKELDFEDGKEMSLYIHIPFCKYLCSFCEYTRTICNNSDIQKHYIETTINDINEFIAKYPNIILNGFDIGGGTPTALTDENFEFLLEKYSEIVNKLKISNDFEPSIEATFSTINKRKLNAISKAGIRRISLGIQTTDNSALAKYRRANSQLDKMKEKIQVIKNSGIEKINLDLMYGLWGQDEATIITDTNTIEQLNPEQVTLYELRTNMIDDKTIPAKNALMSYYKQYFNALTSADYKARFGQNTFSKLDDFGVSSYLKNRMLYGTQYKGFGISAQSMSRFGISYNIGKNANNILDLSLQNTYAEKDTYILPPNEIANKYISIGGYNGSFSLNVVSDFLGKDSVEVLRKPLDFCLSEGLITIENSRVYITEKGFEYYGAVFSLFHT